MSNTNVPDEFRMRIIVCRDSPDLFNHFLGLKQPTRESIYLMRMGLYMHNLLNGKVQPNGIASGLGFPLPNAALPEAIVHRDISSAVIEKVQATEGGANNPGYGQ